MHFSREPKILLAALASRFSLFRDCEEMEEKIAGGSAWPRLPPPPSLRKSISASVRVAAD